ncbi:MAG: DUF4861 family protein [Candidatus Sumerlaeia bacterium]
MVLAYLSASLCQAQLSTVLGSAATTMDPAKVAAVKAATAGTRFYYDTNSDSRPDECWFIDTDPRHTSTGTPILVKVIDQDGDMETGKEPDRDSDLYLADWQANGTVDRAVEYVDNDHDNDMDAMAMYYMSGSNVRAWWSRDDGDDNLLWWDQDYQYVQDPCQHHTHFGGDETFFNLEFNAATQQWAPVWEAPFFFIDNNHDTKTDEVIRVTVNNTTQVATLRWSFDVNPEATSAADPRNFDCSISAYPPTGLVIDGANATTSSLHGYPIVSMLVYDSKAWLRSTAWPKGLFTWVENDNNVGWGTGGNYAYTSERWEGVIADGNASFTAIGGPTCGPFNNRNELVLNNTGPFEYYYNPADRRIHLKNASQAWISVDWDSSYAQDMRYTWTDAAGGDGLLDHIAVDVDGNGTTDDQWDIATTAVQSLTFDYQAFHDAYAPVLASYPAELYGLNRSLAAALESVQAGSSADAVWSLIENKFSASTMPEWKRVKFLGSDISLIYYMELARDRRIARLKTLAASATSFWSTFNAARTAGNVTAMTGALASQFGFASDWTPYATWIADLRRDATQRVNTSTAWSGGIAWETEDVAWRVIDGRFDFLGKRTKQLQLASLSSSTNMSADTGGWGMDALNEGTGPGCGGLTLYVNGTAYPLYGDALTSASYRVVTAAADKSVIDVNYNNVGPAAAPRRVLVRITTLAGRSDTQLQGGVVGGPAGDTVELGVGLVRPSEAYYEHRAASGVVGIWGLQTPSIGWVGIGMLYSPADFSRIIESAGEIDLILKATPGQYVNWTLKNEWLRGERFNNFPVGTNWLEKLAATTVTLPPVAAARGWTTMK